MSSSVSQKLPQRDTPELSSPGKDNHALGLLQLGTLLLRTLDLECLLQGQICQSKSMKLEKPEPSFHLGVFNLKKYWINLDF